MIVAPNSPSAREKPSTAPAAMPREASGSVIVRRMRKRSGAERRGQIFVAAIDLLDSRAHAARDQRKADHHHREDDGLPREDHVDAHGIERLADRTAAAEQPQQQQPRRDRRQNER
jgi:hypothetical protein